MKSLRAVLVLSMIVTILGLGVAAYVMFLGPDRIPLEGHSPSDLVRSGKITPLVVVPLALIMTAFFMRPILRLAFPTEIKDGITAQAQVMKVWDTGVSINDNPQIGLLLRVMPLMTAAFDAEVKTVVSRLKASWVQPGITAEVRYDPRNPKRLQLLDLNIESPASGSAEQRLEELKRLLDKRLITEDEYKRKREEILRAL